MDFGPHSAFISEANRIVSVRVGRVWEFSVRLERIRRGAQSRGAAEFVGIMASPGERRETVLVTGASTGLGLALAKKLLGGSWRLVLTARESSLGRFAAEGISGGENVFLRPLDVTSAREREVLVAEADARWGGIDVLVNNAGVAYRGVVEHFDAGEAHEQMEINFHGPMDLIRRVLPRMREKRHGRIINVSSVSGMMAMPTMAMYSASKFALEGATESLWYEVRPWNIRVTLVQPGFIRSASFMNTRYTAASRRAQDTPGAAYHSEYEHMERLIERLMRRTFARPESVADAIVRTMLARNPPLRVRATWDAHVFAMLRRLLPRHLYHWVLFRSLPSVKTWGQERE
jgi:NAD(P)-dependent dehydrogenase (short-subunit alcohol dehydrogenase family)